MKQIHRNKPDHDQVVTQSSSSDSSPDSSITPDHTRIQTLERENAKLRAELDRMREWLDDILADPANVHSRYNFREKRYEYLGQRVHEWMSSDGDGNDTVESPNIFEHVHPDDRHVVDQLFEKARKENIEGVAPYNVVLRIENKTGGYDWVHSSGIFRFDSDGFLISKVGSTTNVTSEKEIENSLNESERRLLELQENLPIGAFSVNTFGRFLSMNKEFLRTFGYQGHEEAELRSMLPLFADPPERRQLLMQLESDGELRDQIWRAKRKDESTFWASSTVRAVYNEDGKIERIDGNVVDVTNQLIADRELARHTRYEHALFECSRHLLVGGDSTEDPIELALVSLRKANNTSRAVIFKNKEIPGEGLHCMLTHQSVEDGFEPLEPEAREPAPYEPDFERWLHEMQKGRPIEGSLESVPESERAPMERRGAKSVLAVPIRKGGEWFGWIAMDDVEIPRRWDEADYRLLFTAADMIGAYLNRIEWERELQVSLQEKDILLQEVNHRVKNNMQVVSSLLDMQRRSLKDIGANVAAVEAIRESRNRIQAMSRIHDRLHLEESDAKIEFGKYLRELVDAIAANYQLDPDLVSLNVNVDRVLLSVDQAVPCSLIVNELLTNCLKHAFNSESGTIDLTMKTSDGECVIQVRDNGRGVPQSILNGDWKSVRSMGLRLVEMLAQQLHAEVSVKKDSGTIFTIRFSCGDFKQ